jgi:hypothetical protein
VKVRTPPLLVSVEAEAVPANTARQRMAPVTAPRVRLCKLPSPEKNDC